MTLNEFWPSLIRSRNILLVCAGVFLLTTTVRAQSEIYSFTGSLYKPAYMKAYSNTLQSDFPDPKVVLRRSMIIPGWGQVINRQWWKVPIIYGLLGGLTYYSIELTRQYHDYRAAFYNQYSGNDDLRFGPTPDYLVGQSRGNLQSTRNFLRNRRDISYVIIGLAYLLNVVDAYVYAHLRSFDVSDNLSLRGKFVSPPSLTDPVPVPSLSLTVTF